MAAIQEMISQPQPQPQESQFLSLFQTIVDYLYDKHKSGDTVSYQINLLADQFQIQKKATDEEIRGIFQHLEIPRISVIEVEDESEQEYDYGNDQNEPEGDQEVDYDQEKGDGDEGNSDNDNEKNGDYDPNDFVDDRIGCMYCSGCHYCRYVDNYDGYDGYDN